MIHVAAGISEDSDYTSDVGYPIQHSVAQHQLSANVHHANTPAFQFGANASHQLASGQYQVQNIYDSADPLAIQSSSIQSARKLPLPQVQTFRQSNDDASFSSHQLITQAPRKLPMVSMNGG